MSHPELLTLEDLTPSLWRPVASKQIKVALSRAAQLSFHSEWALARIHRADSEANR
jgi:hypothetical protein